MNDHSKLLPPDLEQWIESRVAQGKYFDSGDYIRELIRRDRAQVKDTEWVRERVAERLASGFIDKDASQVIEEIIAERRARADAN